jgi:hypothetical protein
MDVTYPMEVKAGQRLCLPELVGQRCSKYFPEDKLFNSPEEMTVYIETLGGFFHENV